MDLHINSKYVYLHGYCNNYVNINWMMWVIFEFFFY